LKRPVAEAQQGKSTSIAVAWGQKAHGMSIERSGRRLVCTVFDRGLEAQSHKNQRLNQDRIAKD
jgi:hypothetical protein